MSNNCTFEVLRHYFPTYAENPVGWAIVALQVQTQHLAPTQQHPSTNMSSNLLSNCFLFPFKEAEKLIDFDSKMLTFTLATGSEEIQGWNNRESEKKERECEAEQETKG